MFFTWMVKIEGLNKNVCGMITNIHASLTLFFFDMYESYKAKGITRIPNTSLACEILLQQYDNFILREKIMLPIELLSKEQKEKLVAECREVKNHNYTNETLIRDCKLLHVVKTIKNNV